MWLVLALQFLFLIGYVAGSVAFPKPLSPEEEEECLRRMRQGDEGAREELIEHNMRLVAHIVRKYSGISSSWETDDLISVGSIGLIKGISTYREDKNTKLSTYLARCIENEIRMLLRSDKKTRNEVSLQDSIGQDSEGNILTLMDILEYEGEDVNGRLDQSADRRRIMRCMEEALDTREARVIRMRYGLDGGEAHTQRETAAALGYSRSYISRIEKKALEKMRRNMEKRGESYEIG